MKVVYFKKTINILAETDMDKLKAIEILGTPVFEKTLVKEEEVEYLVFNVEE